MRFWFQHARELYATVAMGNKNKGREGGKEGERERERESDKTGSKA